MRVHAFLMPRLESRLSPVMSELFDRLTREGWMVTWSIGEDHVYEPATLRPEHDLYLLKSQAPATMSVAAVLHAQGARILNPWPACAAAQDKVVAAHRLAMFGVPTPQTWAGAQPGRLTSMIGRGALVTKPFNGYHGTGVRFLRGPQELRSAPSTDEATIVQRRVVGDDVKVYVIGDDVFAVRKPFDATSHGRAGQPIAVDPTVREVARRCGEAFGFALYGVDLVLCDDGPVVIDVNHFPGYKGVPDAAQRLCHYIVTSAEEATGRRLPALPRVLA